jgi:hypothetical protein
MDRPTIVIGAISILILGGIIGISYKQQKDFKPRTQCVQHSQSLGMHIHPILHINVNGAPVTIPANIGITPACMMAIHTHDETGTIHLEYPQIVEFKLGDFFANWGQPFSKEQIMENKLDDTHTLTMTVDGQPSDEFENLVMKDGQQIVINYDVKK